MPTSLPDASTAQVRRDEIAPRRALYPVTGRDEVTGLTATLDRVQRMLDEGLDPDAQPPPEADQWLPPRERADPRWMRADRRRREQVIDEQLLGLLWTFHANLLPHPFFWLWPRDLTEKLDDYYGTYSQPLGVPSVQREWASDLSFAAQRLSGVNPMMVRRVTDASDLTGHGDCVIDEDHVKTVIPHADFATDVPAGRLYICDYRDLIDHVDDDGTPPPFYLDGLPWGVGHMGALKYTYAPIALFYWEGELGDGTDPGDDAPDPPLDGRLHPVGIQMRRGSGVTRDQVVLPHHPNWLVARTIVQNADGLMHELRYHLAWCHLSMEAFILCAERTLHEDHPVLKMLRVHYRMHLRIQAVTGELTDPGRAVESLLGPPVATSLDILTESCQAWRFCMHAFPDKELAQRGMLDAPIRYAYRDDGRRIFRAIRRFTERYVALYYPDDAAVAADPELERFVQELQDPALGRQTDLFPTGTGTDVQTRERLAEMLAGILWMAGPQHAAVNFSQWDYMCHVPNMPLALWSQAPPDGETPGPPHPGYFPPDFIARQQVSVLFVLGTWRYDQLGAYQEEDLDDDAAWEVVRTFQEELRRVDDRIERAEDARDVSYPYLRPAFIPNATNV